MVIVGAYAPRATIYAGGMPQGNCVTLPIAFNPCASVMLHSMAKLWAQALRATIDVSDPLQQW